MGLLLGAAACADSGPVSCTALEPGAWVIDGSAMGMAMGASVDMDVEKCEFTFSGWSMEMSSLPVGGVIDGTALSLDGDAHWSSCTGTVEEDGTAAAGTCDEGASEFTMMAGEL